MNKNYFLFTFGQTGRPAKTKKNKSSDPWRDTQERLDRRYRSDFLFVFGNFWADQPKPKKHKKFRPMEGYPGEAGQEI